MKKKKNWAGASLSPPPTPRGVGVGVFKLKRTQGSKGKARKVIESKIRDHVLSPRFRIWTLMYIGREV